MKRISLALILAITFGLAATAWAGEYRMTNNPQDPAAVGKVKIEKDRNGNSGISMHVYHLAQPDTLTPPKTIYVVWVQQKGDAKGPDNMGKLTLNGDLAGAFHSVTPYKSFDLFITAEDNDKVAAPAGPEMLRVTIQR
jgi:hypothetical protein